MEAPTTMTLEEKQKTKNEIRTQVARLTDSAAKNIAIYTLLVVMLEVDSDWKIEDPEAYYQTRGRIRDLAKAARELADAIERDFIKFGGTTR